MVETESGTLYTSPFFLLAAVLWAPKLASGKKISGTAVCTRGNASAAPANTKAKSRYSYDIASDHCVFIKNHLGSTVRTVDDRGRYNNGSEKVYDYLAYGASKLLKTGSDTTEVRQKFTGKEYEPLTQLYAFGARWQDPELGMWMSPDPAAQYFNPYSFAGGDPINRVDPDGRCDDEVEICRMIPTPDGGEREQCVKICKDMRLPDKTVTRDKELAEAERRRAELQDRMEEQRRERMELVRLEALERQKAASLADHWNLEPTLTIADDKEGSDYSDYRGPFTGTYKGMNYLNDNMISEAGLEDANLDLLGIGSVVAGALGKGARGGQGLLTPSKYFGSMTKAETEAALQLKYGAPKSVRPDAKTFYNPQSGRSYNVHHAPGHQGGKPHVDIRTRGVEGERKFLLNDGVQY